MKLNFWQWLGLIILILAVGYWIWDNAGADEPETAPPPPAVQPAAE